MIYLCPFCGHILPHCLSDGSSTCVNCSRVFDSTPFNNLLSAGWLVRKEKISDETGLVKYGYSEVVAGVAIKLVYELGLSHEQLVKALKEIGVSQEFSCIPDEE
jgi:hypothetical protein